MPPVSEIKEKVKELPVNNSELPWRGKQGGTRWLLSKWGSKNDYSLIATFKGFRGRRTLVKEFQEALGNGFENKRKGIHLERHVVWTAKELSKRQ